MVLFAMPYMMALLTELLPLPRFVIYAADLAWITLLFCLVFRKKKQESIAIRILLIFAGVFALYTFIGYLFHFQSGLYYLWGVRNNFRYYVAFAGFALLLTQEKIDDLLGFLDRLFWLNAVITLVQFFILGYMRDDLGGIFGTASGCNAFTNIFLLIIALKTILWYLEKKEKLWLVLAKCGTCFLISALAELKFFFVEFALILVFALLMTRFSWRKFSIVIMAVIGVSLGLMLLVQVFPEYADFFSLNEIFQSASGEQGYTGAGDLNRLTAIGEIQDMFFPKLSDKLFGLGLGNCDTASYDFLTTPFFEQYSAMHYSWLSTAYTFLETGYVGLVFFFGFFVLCFVVISWLMKENRCNKLHGNLARIMAVMCCIIAVYNSSLRTEAGYMAYFVLALPFVRQNQKTGVVGLLV